MGRIRSPRTASGAYGSPTHRADLNDLHVFRRSPPREMNWPNRATVAYPSIRGSTHTAQSWAVRGFCLHAEPELRGAERGREVDVERDHNAVPADVVGAAQRRGRAVAEDCDHDKLDFTC
jgi:hypothetical protein